MDFYDAGELECQLAQQTQNCSLKLIVSRIGLICIMLDYCISCEIKTIHTFIQITLLAIDQFIIAAYSVCHTCQMRANYE